jgi:hypothetical protein
MAKMLSSTITIVEENARFTAQFKAGMVTSSGRPLLGLAKAEIAMPGLT